MYASQLIQGAGFRKQTSVQGVVIKGSRKRFSQCHTFNWSRELWYTSSKEILAASLAVLVIYLALASIGMYQDGLRGIDIPYFLACTLTTVGFGDFSPQSPQARLAAVFFFPFGLIVASFGVANLENYAQSKVIALSRQIEHGIHDAEELILSRRGPPKHGRWHAAWDRLQNSMAVHLLLILRDYLFIIVLGALFFYFNEREQRLQEQRRGLEMTLIDAFYFATVTATTVGYGHKIWPVTNGAKLFMVFYFFVSTAVVGATIRTLSFMYVERKREEINTQLIDSTIWVHKADLHHNGVIFQSDYVLFKLQQMMAVDVDILNRLTKRFEELDEDYSRLLFVGKEVASAEMVAEMQEVMKKTGESLQSQWKHKREQLVEKHGRTNQFGLLESALGGSDRPIKLNECYDFAWSRTLWRNASVDAGRLIFKLFCAYLFLGYLLMAYYDPSIADGNWLTVDGWYFLSATMTTVGIGDYAPNTQLCRGFAIVMIPSGLVVLSMVLAGVSMYRNSLAPTLKADPGYDRLADAHKLFEAIDVNKDGVLTRAEVLAKSLECLDMSPDEAGALFDELDLDKNGTLERSKIWDKKTDVQWHSISMDFFLLFLKLYGVIALGAIFFQIEQ